jgi:hypothetical protein
VLYRCSSSRIDVSWKSHSDWAQNERGYIFGEQQVTKIQFVGFDAYQWTQESATTNAEMKKIDDSNFDYQSRTWLEIGALPLGVPAGMPSKCCNCVHTKRDQNQQTLLSHYTYHLRFDVAIAAEHVRLWQIAELQIVEIHLCVFRVRLQI